MANKYVGDLCFSNGEYEINGEKKKRWVKSAVVFQNDETKKLSFKFETLPATDWSGWMSLFPAKKKDNSQKQNQQNNGGINASDIPF